MCNRLVTEGGSDLMTRETYRRIGAIAGLTIGLLITIAIGYGGQLIPGAILGAGGCVLGAVIAERMHPGSRD
jgi:outer membrane lipoprotein SlyB